MRRGCGAIAVPDSAGIEQDPHHLNWVREAAWDGLGALRSRSLAAGLLISAAWGKASSTGG